MLKYEREMEKQKFGEMDRKQKIQHVAEYYKWHIIVGVLSVLFMYSLLNMYIFNPAPASSVEVAVIGQYVSQEKTGELELELREEFPSLREDNHEIKVITIGFGDDKKDAMTAMASTQKLMAMVSAAEIDVMIGKKDFMMGYAQQGFFMDLSKELKTDKVEVLKERFIQTKIVTESEADTESHPYLLDVSSSDELNSYVDGEALYMGIVINSKRVDNAKLIFDYLSNK